MRSISYRLSGRLRQTQADPARHPVVTAAGILWLALSQRGTRPAPRVVTVAGILWLALSQRGTRPAPRVVTAATIL